VQSEPASDICEALGPSRATLYRTSPGRIELLAGSETVAGQSDLEMATPVRASPRALSAQERDTVLDTLHSERFVDVAPPQVHATLLDLERAPKIDDNAADLPADSHAQRVRHPTGHYR